MPTPKKILVVDDETGIRVLLTDVLLNEGFQVSMAKDGQESLDQMEDDSFDLVITDVHMPKLDGIEMLKCMEKAGRKEKVILMTGDPSDKRLRETDMPHVVSNLYKPFKIDNFLYVVNAAIKNTKRLKKKKSRVAGTKKKEG